MRIKQKTDISTIEELDYYCSEASSTALAAHLMARIARRPGRWRRRMHSRRDWDEQYLHHFDEAA